MRRILLKWLLALMPVLGIAQSTTLNFTAIPTSDPDLVAPFRGPFRWHDMPAGYKFVPDVVPSAEPLDAYYRSFLDWAMMERSSADGMSSGGYDFSAINNVIIACIQRHQRLSFNIMCLHPGATHGPYGTGVINDGGATGGAYMNYPLYVHNQLQAQGGQNRDWRSGNNWVPPWNNNYFLTRAEAFFTALSNFINTGSYVWQGKTVYYRDMIGYIDIGFFGCWGEWNHSGVFGGNTGVNPPAGRQATSASLIRIIDMHRNAFPNYPLLSIMHAFDCNQLSNVRVPIEVGYYSLTARNNWGRFGLKRMNLGRGWEPYIRSTTIENPFVYNIPGGGQYRMDTAIRNIWMTAPVMGEGPNYNTQEGPNGTQGPHPLWNMRYEVGEYHNSNVENGNWQEPAGQAPQINIQGIRDTMRLAWKRTGYRMLLTGGSMPTTLQANSIFTISLNWQNIGVAPVYEDWDVKFRLVNSSGTTIWEGTSAKKLRNFLPSGTSTAQLDNFSLNGVPAGTYSLRLIITDPRGGYRDPFPLAIQGRQTDGSYILRSSVTVGAGNTTTVYAGADQSLASGTTNTQLIGTRLGNDPITATWSKVTGGNVVITPISADSVHIIILFGESNATGRASNSLATSAEMAVRNQIQMWNNSTNVFQNMQLGVNNYQGQNIPSTEHGMENELANQVAAGALRNPTYLGKFAASGTTINEWIQGGAPTGAWGWTYVVSRMNGIRAFLDAQGLKYRITLWQSIGINDYNQGTTNAVFRSRVEKFWTDFDALVGYPVQKIVTYLPCPGCSPVGAHPYNAVYDQMAAANSTVRMVQTADASMMDAAHWSYQGLKTITPRMISAMTPMVSGQYLANVTGLTSGSYLFRLTGSNGSFDEMIVTVGAVIPPPSDGELIIPKHRKIIAGK